MGRRHRTFLFGGIIFSVATIVLTTLLKGPPALALSLGLIPLVIYHVHLTRSRADRLSQTAIDSVYYFGFLVTVAALGASALYVAMNRNRLDFGTVALQFGLGLFATAYAVFARIHLNLRGQDQVEEQDAY